MALGPIVLQLEGAYSSTLSGLSDSPKPLGSGRTSIAEDERGSATLSQSFQKPGQPWSRISALPAPDTTAWSLTLPFLHQNSLIPFLQPFDIKVPSYLLLSSHGQCRWYSVHRPQSHHVVGRRCPLTVKYVVMTSSDRIRRPRWCSGSTPGCGPSRGAETRWSWVRFPPAACNFPVISHYTAKVGRCQFVSVGKRGNLRIILQWLPSLELWK